MEGDEEAGIPGGNHLLLSLPPGSSRAVTAELTVLEKNDSLVEPYTPVYSTKVTGRDEVAVLPIGNPAEEVVHSTIFVNGREVESHTYSLCDDHDGTDLDPHVHELKTVPYTVDYPTVGL